MGCFDSMKSPAPASVGPDSPFGTNTTSVRVNGTEFSLTALGTAVELRVSNPKVRGGFKYHVLEIGPRGVIPIGSIENGTALGIPIVGGKVTLVTPTAPASLKAVVGDQEFTVSVNDGKITIKDAEGSTVVRVGMQDDDVYVRVNPDITTPRQTFTLDNL